MRTHYFFSFLIFLSIQAASQTTTGSFTHGGQTRTYRVHLPPGFNPATSRPLVLNLHGLSSNGQQQELYTGFNTVADTANIIVVYPNALNGSGGVPEWNAYGLGSTDDVGFLLALIDSMQSQYNIDLSRVYCIGLSNGGYMSYRMACTNSCRIVAIASVAGLLVENILTPCNISRPVPLLHIHGTADGTVAYSGVAATIASWRGKNGCPSTPATSSLPDINTSDNSTVTVSTYTFCNNEADVILYTVNNGGHTWPGSSIPLGPTTNQDFNASATIWNFLRKYSMAAYISPNPASVCVGRSTPLTASGGTSYSWSTGATGSSINVTPATDQTYSVTINFGGACSETGSRTVTVTTGLIATITPATAVICSGASIGLTAAGGASYTWSTGITGAGITVSPTSTTTYTVTVNDVGNGCSTTTSRTVTVNPNPIVTMIGGSSGVCRGSSVTLSATGGISYSWSTGQTGASISASPTITSTYTVTATDLNACTATASQSVMVHSLPAPAITPATVSICSGSATLTASGGSLYSWSNGGVTSSITVSPLSTTTYTVSVTDDNGCTASTSRTVNVSATLIASISPSVDSICWGESAELTAFGGINYSWSNGSTNSSITVTPTGSGLYTVTANDGGTCSDTTSAWVTVIPLPNAAASASPSSVVQGNSTRLTASGGTGYSWSNGLSAAVLTLYPSATSTYTVTVTLDGCTDTAQVTVMVLPSGMEEAGWLGSVNIYPNPTNSILNIECRAEMSSAIAIEIYSVEGKKVYEVTKDAITANHHLQISMKELSLKSGMYYIRLKAEKGIVTRKSVFIE